MNTPGLNSDIRPPDSKFSERHRSSCQQGGGPAVKLSLPEYRTYISPAAQGARSPSCLASGATTSPTKSHRKNYTDSGGTYSRDPLLSTNGKSSRSEMCSGVSSTLSRLKKFGDACWESTAKQRPARTDGNCQISKRFQ